MILIDSNVPMFIVGGSHPHRLDAGAAVTRAIAAGERLVTNAEVLQEICHRYQTATRIDMIQRAFDAVYGIVDEVLPVARDDMDLAKDLLLRRSTGLSSRDAVHVAVMQNHGIDRIMSFDRGFDAVPGIERVS